MEIKQIVDKQRDFFNGGATFSVDYRLDALKKLKQSILAHVDDLTVAFKTDFNKCEFDVCSTEVGMVLQELNFFLKRLRKLSRPTRVRTSLTNYSSYGKIVRLPYGVTLVVSPWNYPFQLTFVPLIGAIAAGNTAVVKPSSKTPNVSKVIKDILSVFDEEYVYVNCERDETLFEQKFDFMFYTGSADFAKKIREVQAKNLVPCVLELGGKSPCVVDRDADVDLAAKRIAWGKFLNAGQTCVAPDYCVVHESVKEEFIKKLLEYIRRFYFLGDALRDDYPYVITESKVKEVLGLIEGEKIIVGGKAEGRKMYPTVVDEVTFDSPIMQNEIFAPVLPVLTFTELKGLLAKINVMDRPLAFYYFSESKAACDYVAEHVVSGGGCMNDTVMHLTEERLPFGGVGKSGTGSYHGAKSYETFTHAKSLLYKNKQELNLKYPPYTDAKTNFVKRYFGINKKQP